ERSKTIAAALKKLRKLGRDIAAAQERLAAVTAEAEAKKAALAEREAAIDARASALDERETAFASSLTDARDELREHHARLEQTNQVLVYRIMSSAGILGEWTPQLQSLPDWQQLRRMVAGLPDDLPAAPFAEVVSQNVREDWSGNVFVPDSTLTRSINKAS